MFTLRAAAEATGGLEAWRLGGPEAERDRGKTGSEGLEGHLGILLASFCVMFHAFGLIFNLFLVHFESFGVSFWTFGGHLGSCWGPLGRCGVIWCSFWLCLGVI